MTTFKQPKWFGNDPSYYESDQCDVCEYAYSKTHESACDDCAKNKIKIYEE